MKSIRQAGSRSIPCGGELRHARWALLAFLPLALAACTSGFATVEVDKDPSLPDVYQVQSVASDGTATSTALGPTDGAPISFPKTFVIRLASSETSLQVVLVGLDRSGNPILRGADSRTGFAAGSSLSIKISLTPACGGIGDCDPDSVCQGAVTCSDAGACVPVQGGPANDGSGCGNDGGHCYSGACHATQCGDGIVEVGEQCDLGPANSDHGQCTSKCLWASCGDGMVNQDPLDGGGFVQEQCDWGTPDAGCTGPDGGCNANAPNHCRPDCTSPRCGDGIVDTGERCDKGAQNGTGQGCNASCTLLGKVTLIAGNGDPNDAGCGVAGACWIDGPAAQAEFLQPSGIAIVGNVLYVADTLNYAIRAVDLGSMTVSTLAGGPYWGTVLDSASAVQDGVGADAGFFLPLKPMAWAGGLWVGAATALRQVTVPQGAVTTLAGGSSLGEDKTPNPPNLPPALPLGPSVEFEYLTGLCTDGALVYAVDNVSGVLKVIDPDGGTIQIVAGSGVSSANFSSPTGCAVLDGGIYLTESGTSHLRRFDPISRQTADLIGTAGSGYQDGLTGAQAELLAPNGICTNGRTIFIMDSGNRAIREFDPVTTAVTTVAGAPDSTTFDNPYDCTWDPDGGVMYVTDQAKPKAGTDRVGNVIYRVE